MEKENTLLLLKLLQFFLLFHFSHSIVAEKTPIPTDLKTYIIQVAPTNKTALTTAADRKKWYLSFIPRTLSGGGESRLLYSYTEVFSGFAARLTDAELDAMKNIKGFVRAIPDRKLQLHTTRTPLFLGLKNGTGLFNGNQPRGQGKGVIIGMLDSGFTPGHPSFDDANMPPRPARFRGRCDAPEYCNNKVIGARSFTRATVVDVDGHGTHTASTAAGSFVRGVSVLGLARGTASGTAPRAHLSIYKVCNFNSCNTSDVLAGMDAAVMDGVDILSISLGGSSDDYFDDPIAVGAFAAVRRGILVSCSAGNDGIRGLSNEAPWLLAVGASSIDRRLSATLRLGDGRKIPGVTAFQPVGPPTGPAPLVFPGQRDPSAYYCDDLDNYNVTGKIVLCVRGGDSSRIQKGTTVQLAGGIGMVLANRFIDGDSILDEPHVLPALAVTYADGSRLMSYISTTASPRGTIEFHGTLLGTRPAPVVASFSSKGPSKKSPLVLKPDVIAPGVGVVAAFPPFLQPTRFEILSGTSMAAPHVSGIAALLKAARPDLSPSAIMSALVTTAYRLGNDREAIRNEHGRPASVYEMGSGHADPNKAADPGLVYETSAREYLRMLCGLGYSDADVAVVAGEPVSCTAEGSAKQYEVNYPSISVPRAELPVTVRRLVTNVGDGAEEYEVVVNPPEGVEVEVNPPRLCFAAAMERKSFEVTFRATETASPGLGLSVGRMNLVSGKHLVKSLLVVYA